MKNWVQSIICFLLVFSLFPHTMSANEQSAVSLDDVKSAILIDQHSGMIVTDKNSRESLSPASMTKIATMLLIMEAIDSKKITWEDKIRASEKAASMGGSQIFLKAGEEMTVRDMVKGIAIASANDAAVAMAEHLAGSEEDFVKQMNAKVNELGLKNTVFKNTTGLPAEGHVSSAYDMALLARELLKHEEIIEFTGTYEDYLRKDSEDPFWLVNTNKLVRFYKGADGLKTGFTKEAMYCLTATAQKNDMRFIAVVFGAPTSKARNEIVSSMLDYGFAHYKSKTMAKEGETVTEARVEKGSPYLMKGVLSAPLKWLSPVNGKEQEVKKSLRVSKELAAPVKKGDEIGTMSLIVDGKEMSSVPVVAESDSVKASFGELLVRSMEEMIR
ncbi:D-alanyl-D-alanine carboxypeptidase family protein [Jeotgalibacillus proteolyticus]|uniref:serine-type D-Ala-D-Ala carboxypeptidase n=1 Tax=Jeotgalibacillus proteolyticus TaxID=2082395 RepID=A0A2S5GE38_9BACL|nr:D-alanyl-D-alanine carboxypeptidase family protein [Jeotgalibacillus proteolyticus]PPA71312.1 D-alanyl-D-alanine carboxypeptidase [Jeotgalibacillus proteolyticus]